MMGRSATLGGAADDRSAVRRGVKRQRLRQNLRAALLVAPLFVFLSIFFFMPVASMLSRSVANPEIGTAFPLTADALQEWGEEELPGEATYAAFVQDLKSLAGDRIALGRAARRLNFEVNGYRSLLISAVQAAPDLVEGPYREAMVAVDPRFGEREFWAVMRRGAGFLTDHYLLAALDLRRDAQDAIVGVPSEEAVFIDVYGRTLWISAQVAFFCLLLGYPFAYMLATLSARSSNLLMFFVLLPFWTALLARTTAWIVLLQREGAINKTLMTLGFIAEPLPLVFNRVGVLVAMTHVLLPFFILPAYSVMRGINPQYMRAAKSLGAHPLTAFLRVYLPLSLPGVAAGCLLVFILSIGYYVTPALVGGARDQLVSTFIALYTDTYLNWGLASALAVVVLVIVLLLYAVYSRLGRLNSATATLKS